MTSTWWRVGCLAVCVGAVAVTAPRAQQASALDQLLQRYTTGDSEAAVAELARWPAAAVLAAEGQVADVTGWRAAALLLLRLEAGQRNHSLSLGVDLDVHGPAATRLLDRLTEDDTALPEFRDFVSRVVPLMPIGPVSEQSRRLPRVAAVHLQAARRVQWMPWTPTNHFYSTEVLGPRISTSHGQFGRQHSASAESHLREALTLDPHLNEARVRLGRLYYLLGRTDDARGQFEAVLEAPALTEADPTLVQWPYLAALFLGELLEADDQVDEARRRYEQALKFLPSDVANVALGRVLLRTGNTAAAWEVLRTGALAARGTEDPWYAFDARYTIWKHAERLQALRPLVRAGR